MKNKKVSALLITVCLCMAAFWGCGNETVKTETITTNQETEDAAEEKYTVTFYESDGTTVISEQEVVVGMSAEEFVPEKEGQVFMGWFATPSLSHAFDFTSEIKTDTSVFAGFMEDVEDTRTFAIVGSGTSSLLSSSSWGKVINEEHYLTKDENTNVYTITLDLAEGDEFQFAIDSSWSAQRGGGYLETDSLNGTTYFNVSGGITSASQKANIKCLVSGNYTLTLTTYPGADVYDTENSYYTEETKENYNSNPYDKITWTYNGDMLEAQEKLDITYYIKGAVVTGWEDKYDDMYAFTEENGIHTLKIELTEGDEFLFTTLVGKDGNESVGNEYVRYSNIVEEDSLALVDKTDSMNIVAKAAGTYTFTYTPDTKELKVSFE